MPKSPGLVTYPPLPHEARNADELLVKFDRESYSVSLRCNFARRFWKWLHCFNSGKSFASSASKDIEPVTFSPLMKKVGVAPTFN